MRVSQFLIVGASTACIMGLAISCGSSDNPPPQLQAIEVKPPKPLSDADKVSRSRATLSTWKGDGDEYAACKSMLSTVARTSPQYKDARMLLDRWEKRKKEADANQAREASLAAKRQKEEARQLELEELKKAKERMKYFDGAGPAQVAVGNVKLHQSTENHEANEGYVFVYVFVAVKNTGADTIHANPNDFTLADTDGNTVPPESDTYGLDNYFDAVNLTHGQQTDGWLIFLLKRDKKYTLTRSGMMSGGDDVVKTVVP